MTYFGHQYGKCEDAFDVWGDVCIEWPGYDNPPLWVSATVKLSKRKPKGPRKPSKAGTGQASTEWFVSETIPMMCRYMSFQVVYDIFHSLLLSCLPPSFLYRTRLSRALSLSLSLSLTLSMQSYLVLSFIPLIHLATW